MDHVNAAVENVATVIGTLGGLVTMLVAGLQFASLEAALAGIAAISAATALYVIYRLGEGIDDRLSELETKMDSGFSESLKALDDADETNYTQLADGGEWREVRGLDVEKMDFSGIPSVAGAGALGAIGALFGPGGAAAGALIGAIAGGGKEYKDLEERHQDRLETAAWAAVKKETSVPGFRLQLEEVEDDTRFTNDYWVFKFVEEPGLEHFIRISKNDGKVEYRPPVNDYR